MISFTGASPKDCADIQHGGADTDGVYTIYPSDQPLQVYCDLTTDGGGWTVRTYSLTHTRKQTKKRTYYLQLHPHDLDPILIMMLYTYKTSSGNDGNWEKGLL